MKTKDERDLLQGISDGAVTWRASPTFRVRRGDTYRLWLTETAYVLASRDVGNLVASGLAKKFMAAGYQYASKGGVELTPEGYARLAALNALVENEQ